MPRTYSAEYKRLQPYIIEEIRKVVNAIGLAGSSTGSGTVAKHALSDLTKHSGELAQTQAPWAATKVELSNHAALPDVHHARATAGTGISVTGQQVGLAAGANYQFIGTGGGTAAGWRNVSELAGSGLAHASGILAVGVANTGANGLSVEADAVRLTSNSNPGAAAAVLASDASGYLNLVRLVLTDRLRASLLDTASGDMSITPAGDLTINPGGGEIFIPGADTVRSSAWTPGLLGTGWGIQERAAGKSHLDIRSIYTDELIATTFTADQVRVRMGSDWLGEALAIAARDNSDAKVTIPNVGGGSVRIYVENAPEVAGQIFDANEHVLIKTINRSSGLVIRETWGQVSSYIAEAGNRQSYLWTTTSGSGNFLLEPGTALVGFGVSGGSYIYRTVIEAGRGPYERFATWSTNPYTPANRVSRVEVGDIKNAAGDSTTRYGIAAGNNIALTPSTGFSGFTSDSVYGMRMYNTLLHLYDSSYLKVKLEAALGLLLLADTGGVPSTAGNSIRWTPDLTAGSPTVVAEMYSGSVSTTRTMTLRGYRGAQSFGHLVLAASNNSGDQAYISLRANSDGTGGLYSQVEGSYSWNVSASGGFNFTRAGGTLPTMTVNSLYTIWHSGNDGAGSGLDADLFHGLNLPVSGNRWGAIPYIDGSGVMEIGKYIDFHDTDGDVADYSARLNSYGGGIQVGSVGAYGGGVYTPSNGSAYGYWEYVYNGARTAYMQWYTDRIQIVTNPNKHIILYPDGTGKVGIINTAPSYTLDVTGEARVTGAIRTDTALSLLPVSTPAASATYFVLFLDTVDGKLKYRITTGLGSTVRTLSYT